MGYVLGKIDVKIPKFELIRSTDEYKIRKYSPSVIAKVTYNPTQFKGKKDIGFMILANYIGALGNPQNSKPEKIAMTALVITQTLTPKKITMAASVVMKGGGGEEVGDYVIYIAIEIQEGRGGAEAGG